MALIGLIIIAVALMALLVLGVSGIRWKPPVRNASRKAGPCHRPDTWVGDIVSALTSPRRRGRRQARPGRLDDDGASAAVTWPQITRSASPPPARNRLSCWWFPGTAEGTAAVLLALCGSTAIITSSLKELLLAIRGVFRRGGQCNFRQRRPLLSHN